MAHPLWRVEVIEAGKRPRLLVQSLTAPTWEEVAARHPGYLLHHHSKPLNVQVGLVAGRRLRFRLEANPTVTRDGKRHGLWRLDDQLAWLARQAERGGFTVATAVVTRQERLVLRKGGQAREIILYAVLFDGHLRVDDGERFGSLLAHGGGHGRRLG